MRCTSARISQEPKHLLPKNMKVGKNLLPPKSHLEKERTKEEKYSKAYYLSKKDYNTKESFNLKVLNYHCLKEYKFSSSGSE